MEVKGKVKCTLRRVKGSDLAGKRRKCGFTDVERISRGKGFVTFSKYSLIAFVLWVDVTAMKKVSKVHDVWSEQTFN